MVLFGLNLYVVSWNIELLRYRPSGWFGCKYLNRITILKTVQRGDIFFFYWYLSYFFFHIYTHVTGIMLLINCNRLQICRLVLQYVIDYQLPVGFEFHNTQRSGRVFFFHQKKFFFLNIKTQLLLNQHNYGVPLRLDSRVYNMASNMMYSYLSDCTIFLKRYTTA